MSFQYPASSHRLWCLQGRLRVDSWQDKTTGAKRTAYKVVASSISRVRRTGAGMPASVATTTEEPAAGFGVGGHGEAAPWDAPPPMQQGAAPLQQQVVVQPPAGQAALGAPFTEERLWMDFFTDPSRESAGGAAAPPYSPHDSWPTCWLAHVSLTVVLSSCVLSGDFPASLPPLTPSPRGSARSWTVILTGPPSTRCFCASRLLCCTW